MINSYNCVAAGQNTGFGNCPLILQKVVGAILVWKNFVLTAADLATDATLQAALTAAATADIKNNRIYPFPGFEDITDNSTEPAQQTLGYGAQVATSDGNVSWSFPFLRGGICLLKAAQQFNYSDVRVLFYDSNGTLFGWKVGETMKGIPLIQFFAPPWKVATATTAMETRISFTFQPRYINAELGFYKTTDFSLDSIEGMQNVVLKQTGVQAKPVYKVKAFAGCDGLDMSLYSVEMANVARWRANNSANGNQITITSVVADANIGGWTITLDVADPDYPAVGSIKLSWAPPSVLIAAGVVGFESIPLTIVNA